MRKRENTFKNYARNQAFKYSIIPVIFTVILISIIGILILKFSEFRNTDVAHITLKKNIEKDFEKLEKFLDDKEVNNVFTGFFRNTKPKETVYYEVYKNRSEIDINFDILIFNNNELMLTTLSDSVDINNYREINKWQSNNLNKDTEFIISLERKNFIINPIFIKKYDINDNEYELLLILNNNSIKSILEKSSNTINFISGRYDQVISSNNNKIIGQANKINFDLINKNKILLDGDNYLYRKSEISNLGIFVNTLYKSTDLSDIAILILILIVLTLFITLIVIKITWDTINEKNTEALDKMIFAIRKNRKGDLNSKIEDKVFDEFLNLYEEYNAMILSIKELFKENEEILVLNQVDHLNLLNSQFNSHFLFNTLESLRYLIYFDKDSADDYIIELSKLLRYSIDNKGFYSSIKEEIEYVKSYLKLQKIRYQDRLDYKISINKDLLFEKVPKLIIQPIVENAIKYVYSHQNKLILTIIVDSMDDKIIIKVKDNGPGIKKQIIEKINDNLKNYSSSMGLGLFNLNKKLEYLYDEYIFNIRNTGEGLLIEIIIKKENNV